VISTSGSPGRSRASPRVHGPASARHRARACPKGLRAERLDRAPEQDRASFPAAAGPVAAPPAYVSAGLRVGRREVDRTAGGSRMIRCVGYAIWIPSCWNRWRML